MTTIIDLFKKIQAQVCNNIKQHRQKAGYPEESPTDNSILNLLYPKIQPPYDGIKYSIDLSAEEIKQLLTVLEEYPDLKSERDFLWNQQTIIFKMRNRAVEILKDSRLDYKKRYSAVCHVFGLIGDKKRPKFNKVQIKFEYEQLVKGYYCQKEKNLKAPISSREAITFLTKKYKFASEYSCYKYLRED